MFPYIYDREINDSFQSSAYPTSVNAIVIFPRTHKRKKYVLVLYIILCNIDYGEAKVI